MRKLAKRIAVVAAMTIAVLGVSVGPASAGHPGGCQAHYYADSPPCYLN